MFQEYRLLIIRHVERHRPKTVILSSKATRANIKCVKKNTWKWVLPPVIARNISSGGSAARKNTEKGKRTAERLHFAHTHTHTNSLEGRGGGTKISGRPAKSGHGGTPKSVSLSPFIFFLHLYLVLLLQKVITFLSLSLSFSLWGKQLARLEALDFQVKLHSVAKDFDIENSVDMFRLWSTSHQQENDPLNHDAKINELKAAIGPLSGRSLQFCTDACFRRYLEARNWNLDKAKKMLEETLKWRSTYKPEEIRWREVACEGETGKVYRASFRDRSGRTVLILRPGMQNTVSIDNQMRHLVYLIENAVFNLPEGQEQMAWLIDFTGWTLSTTVPVKSARDTINILQNHYPERLAVAFLYNPARIFEAFWKIVKYFLDNKTFHKVKFVYPKNKESVELMKQYFDEENLPIEFGGPAILNYDHEEFSKLMNQDDVKSAAFWCPDDKPPHWANGRSGAEVVPEPVSLAPAAS